MTHLTTEPITPPVIQTVTGRKTVDAGDVDRALSSQWLAVDLQPGQSVSAWGAPVTANPRSTVLIGSSSEFQFCVVTAGQVRRGDLSADTGHVIFWSMKPGAKPQVLEFSGRDFQQSMRTAGRDDLADSLNSFTDSQNKRRWWGLVRPMNVNIGAPMGASVDQTRKSYLLQPEVVKIRKSARNADDIAPLTARVMLAHLKSQETDGVAQLLSPEWFLEPAKRGELDQARHAVAASLVGQSWTKNITDNSLRATDDPMRYWFSSGKQNFIMTLKPFDEMVYVLSIVPEESK